MQAAAGSLAGTVCALVAAAAAGMGSSGAVWGVVPFLGSKDALGATAGIVGAAGPIGERAAGPRPGAHLSPALSLSHAGHLHLAWPEEVVG